MTIGYFQSLAYRLKVANVPSALFEGNVMIAGRLPEGEVLSAVYGYR